MTSKTLLFDAKKRGFIQSTLKILFSSTIMASFVVSFVKYFDSLLKSVPAGSLKDELLKLQKLVGTQCHIGFLISLRVQRNRSKASCK